MVMRPSGTVSQQFRVLFGAGTAVGLDDGELLERFVRSRDEAAFAALVARHGPLVLGACRRLLPAHDVEDAFQATFLVLVRQARSLRDRRLLGSWLYRVAYRIALRARAEALRHAQNAPETTVTLLEAAPVDDIERHEIRAVIDEEIHRLPGRFRLPVVLCDLEGLSREQAAARLGCPLGTVNSRLSTARERLRERLRRRGFAPPALAAFWAPEPLRELPPWLVERTLTAAQRVAGGSAVAAVSSATVATLAEALLQTTIRPRLKTAAAVLLAAGAAMAWAAAAPPAKAPETAAAAPVDDGTVAATGRVVTPDGAPAVGATVAAMTDPTAPALVARTDNAGRFRLQGAFEDGAQLLARSADGTLQVLRGIPPLAVRTELASELVLTLAPAARHEVKVTAGGRAVPDARVCISGQRFDVQGVTERDGTLVLNLPAGERPARIAAWHPNLGVGGKMFTEKVPSASSPTTELALVSPAPHAIRAIDTDGKPVAGLELTAAFRLATAAWIAPIRLSEARVRTNAEGVATIPWAPRENLESVDVHLAGADWKLDDIDSSRVAERVTTVHVRRERTIEGRLVMPAGANAQGVLIQGFGFGPKNRGDRPNARARRDGTFTLRACADHAYVLAVDDMTWASDPWAGPVIGKDGTPAAITLNVYPATPVLVRVTRGPRHQPLANAWVMLSSKAEVSWTDAEGKKRSGMGGLGDWLWTDAQGVARAAVGKGLWDVQIRAGEWTEARKFDVADKTPVAIEFHRSWTGERRVSGRLTRDGARFTPSTTATAHAWATNAIQGRLPLSFTPEIRRDGTVEVTFDADNLSVLFLDPAQGVSGFVSLGADDSALDLRVVPNATYSGSLVETVAPPRALANRSLRLDVRGGPHTIATRRTNQAGRFRFEDVPSGVPLRLYVENEPTEPPYFLFDGDRFFEPGEHRRNDSVQPSLRDLAGRAIVRRRDALNRRVAMLCKDARVGGMRALVVLAGDATPAVRKTTDRLLDADELRAVLSYRPLRVEETDWKRDEWAIAESDWPKPAAGEVMLIVLSDDGNVVVSRRIVTHNIDEAVSAGAAFFKANAPPPRDALALLAAARNEAGQTGRRVWVVLGGPRCGPCFQFGRWLDEQHSALEKDYVVVKIMQGLDIHADEVTRALPITQQSIPWHAITEPNGTVLATSEGPLGNIGHPSSVESLRHLRAMLEKTSRQLKEPQVSSLIRSLASQW